MSYVDEARDAVARRIALLSGDATVDQLKSLAEAAASLYFGPEGGNINTNYDYHSTVHPLEPRNGAGF